jgi:hypothetical protein
VIRKHASIIVGLLLIVLVIGACVVRSSRPAPRRGGPVYVEKHKHKKHKHKKPKKWKH